MCQGPEARKPMVSSRRLVQLQYEGQEKPEQNKLGRRLLKCTMLKRLPSTFPGVVIVETSL